MAEPKVGMRFSSYLEMGKTYEQKSTSTKVGKRERQVNSNSYDKVGVFYTSYIDKNGDFLAHSTLETYGEKQRSNFSTEAYIYRGEGSIYDSDLKYTHIYGTKTYAIDLNNNGIVDNGEIFNH